jgi:hypothetical protein
METGNLEDRVNLGDVGVNGKMLLKCVLEKYDDDNTTAIFGTVQYIQFC